MKVFLQFFFLLFLTHVFISCNSQTHQAPDGSQPYTNALIHSSSPYLLQHAHNPVDWYPWSEEALQKAKKENKLLIISIGYAACHWCHVMEHESFEDSIVADMMNRNFVSIKVDREERPDIDQIYMDAAMIINQRGGWPLNAIALPDGKPVFAGTYFPKEEWLKFLKYFSELYKSEKGRQRMQYQAAQIAQGLDGMNLAEIAPKPEKYTEEMLSGAFQSIEKKTDFKRGGLAGAPKFPMPVVHEFLLEHHYYTKNPKALEAVRTTLDAMQMGGIYDHLRGGFARYSTDGQWLVPHFEKMLYDNAQLVSLYSKAYQLTKNPTYKKTVYETLEWIEAEMTDLSGGFYSSLDADSEGEEGKFYVWTSEEIEEVLGEGALVFMDFYGVKKGGNWEGKNILHTPKSLEVFAKEIEMNTEQLRLYLEVSRQKLLETRNKRVRPGLDDKILTSWNALMLRGYVDAWKAFGEQKFLDAALKNGRFIQDKCQRSGGELNRNFKEGESTINGFADDYSFTIEAFLALYQATFDPKWLSSAEDLMKVAILNFYDEKSGTFFYTSGQDPELITRKQELQDNVIPSSNSSLGKSLFALGTYLENEEYLQKAAAILNHSLENLDKSASFFANYAILLNRFVHKPYEVAIVGEKFAEKLSEWNKAYHPGVYLLGGVDEGGLSLLKGKLVEGETKIYVCKDRVCKLPVKEVERAWNLLVEHP